MTMGFGMTLRTDDRITFEGMDYEAKRNNYSKGISIVEMRWYPGHIGQIYIGRGAIANKGYPIYKNARVPSFIRSYLAYVEAVRPSLVYRRLLLVTYPRR